MRIPCRLCKKPMDVRMSDFNRVADFAGRFNTIAKFICWTCSLNRRGVVVTHSPSTGGKRK